MQGVAENFIGVLRKDYDRTGRRMLRVAAGALLVSLLAALLVDLRLTGRLVGLGVGYTFLALSAGLLLGAAWGWVKWFRLYDRSLRRNWNRWMKYSVACVSSTEIYRKVNGKETDTSSLSIGLGLGVLLFVSLLLLAMSLVDGGISLATMPFFLFYGVLLGAPLGEAVVRRLWTGLFIRSLDDMVRKGDVSVWGVY